MKPEFSAETNAAITASLEAAKIAMHYLDKEKNIKEKSRMNLVTVADVKCEKKIKEVLAEKFPDYGFLGEETGNDKKGSRYWVVDPIDGTHNFACRVPIFCHSIALVEGKLPVLGVVYDPARKDLYVAEKGKGAYLNGEKIIVSQKSELKDCLIGTGFPYAEGIKRENTLKSISALTGKSLGIRRLGSAALDICYVASGLFGGVFFYELQPWDIAAAMLILHEAGGKTTDANGKEPDIFSGHFATSNSLIHDKLIACMERI